jgi:hypothetical protein
MKGDKIYLTEKCMNNVMNDNCPEIIGILFEDTYYLRSNGKFLRPSKPNEEKLD